MKLVSYNIQYGFGADGRYDLARAVKVVAGADVIALQEVERSWTRSNNDDQPELTAGYDPASYHTHVRTLDGTAQKRRLDYCFAGPMFADRVRSVSIDTSATASDHFPVFTEIDLDTRA